MPGIFTLMAESALSGPSESFVLCVFNLYYFFLHCSWEKRALNPETKPNTTPKISQHALTSVSVVPQLVLIF